MAIGSEEAFHSGFDATMKGAYPKDFLSLVRSLQKVEAAGAEKSKAISSESEVPVYQKLLLEWMFLPVRKGGRDPA